MSEDTNSLFKSCAVQAQQPKSVAEVKAMEVVETVLSGSAQVTVVLNDKSFPTPDAGASPHAPLLRPRGRPKKTDSKDGFLGFRLPKAIKDKFINKANALETDSSSYLLELVLKDLELPTDELAACRNLELKKTISENTVAMNRIGTLLNQIAAATHMNKLCALTEKQIDELMKGFRAIVQASLYAGFT